MNLDHWSDWLAARIGINLSRGSAGVFRTYIERRSRALGLNSPEALRTALNQSDGAEFQRLVDALTVTHTWFFRDPEQLDALAVLMRAAAQQSAHRPIQIWTAGCASGEETYTVALIAGSLGIDVHVLGTDLNANAVERARRGEYGSWSCHALPRGFSQHFTSTERTLRLATSVRRSVTFAVHNLLEPPPKPPTGDAWDFVLCRNVLIYFTPRGASECLDGLTRALRPEGYLLLGASDVLLEAPPRLLAESVGGRIVFRRSSQARLVRSDRPKTLPAFMPRPERRRPIIEAPETVTPARARQSAIIEGHRHMAAGNLEEARRHYTQACAQDPLSAPARLYAGVAHYLAGDLDAALQCLRGCLVLDERCWLASYYLAASFEGLGLAPEAEREYQHAAGLCQSAQEVCLEGPESPLFEFQKDLAWLVRRRARAS